MKKKIIYGVSLVIVLVVAVVSFNIYKDYKDFDSLRTVVYADYIPALKETMEYLEEYSDNKSLNNLNLSSGEYVQSLDKNLELQKRFEQAKLDVYKEDVETEDAVKLKENVLVAIDLYESVLLRTYDGEDIDELENDFEILSVYISEMNEILENHW